VIACTNHSLNPNVSTRTFDARIHYRWTWSGGIAKGRRARSFYVFIRDSTSLLTTPPPTPLDGMVHGSLAAALCGSADEARRLCAGGFAVVNG
jgi:hypothetical protein